MHAADGPAGIIIPLYTYPGSTWETVAQVHRANDGVPMVAVINPASGPGVEMDQNYVRGILRLRAAGVMVIGYVATGYASTSVREVEALVGRYKGWYSLDGIFFDEMTSLPGKRTYYSALDAQAKSLGLPLTMGNPGRAVARELLGTMETTVIYENRGLPDTAYLRASSVGMPKKSLAMIAYGVQSISDTYAVEAAAHVGYIYATDGELPNPYDSLPPYLESLASTLQRSHSRGQGTRSA